MDVTVRLRSIRAEHSGLPKLTIQLHVKSNAQGAFAIANLIAEVRVARTLQFDEIATDTRFVGYGVYEPEVATQFIYGTESTWTFGLTLTQHLLQQIEEFRNGGDIVLVMRFLGLAADFGSVTTPQFRAFLIPSIRAESWSGQYNPF